MSGIALVWAANVKGLKPHAKIVLIQLADFHNKETGRCFPSAKRLAYECEMDRATVFRHLTILEEKGLVTRHARGVDGGGRTSNQYELHLDIALGPSASHRQRSQIATGAKVAETHSKGRTPATGVVAQSDCNLNKEPVLNLKDARVRDILLSILSPEMTDAYIDHRKAKRAKITEKAASFIVEKLLGHPDPDAVVKVSIENGWTGIFPEKGNQNGKPTSNDIGLAADRIAQLLR